MGEKVRKSRTQLKEGSLLVDVVLNKTEVRKDLRNV